MFYLLRELLVNIKITGVTAFRCPIYRTLNAKTREKTRKMEKTRAFEIFDFV
jgi:hypothetical protein